MIAPLLQSMMKLVSYDGCAEFLVKDAPSFLQFMDNIYGSKELVGMKVEYESMTSYLD